MESFCHKIIKVLKSEIGEKYHNDFHYLYTFTATHSPKDSSNDKLFTSFLITESPTGVKEKLELCCSHSNSRHFSILPIEEIILLHCVPSYFFQVKFPLTLLKWIGLVVII